MDPRIVFRGGVDNTLVGSCSLYVWADGGEGNGEVDECRYERGACVSDWKGDKLHHSLVFLEGRDEGGVFLGLLHELDDVFEVSAKADLDDDEVVMFLVKGRRV